MQQVFDAFLMNSFREMVTNCVSTLEKDGWTSFGECLRDGLNQIGIQFMKLVLETSNKEFVEQPKSRPGWIVERHGDKKTILTVFGQLEYERTYFKNKKTGAYAHLADSVAEYSPHQRIDVLLEAQVVQEASEMSYRKAGRHSEVRAKGTEISGQTVMNLVRRFQPESQKPVVKQEPLRVCPRLYIEADEDHVANQIRIGDGPNRFDQKLVYIHEGRQKQGKERYSLVGKHYFTFKSGTSTSKIWETVWRYIQEKYDTDAIEEIFVSGDGAGWIKAGVDYLPCAHFVLDRFHIQKAVLRSAAGEKELVKRLNKAIWQGKRSEMNQTFREMLQDADTESRRKTVADIRKYFNNNWSGIQAYRKWGWKLVSCSAEGHVSHVLAGRLSSRPMAWTRHGANQMANLRVHRANGVDVQSLYIQARKKRNEPTIPVSDQTLCSLLRATGTSHEDLGNIPMLGAKRSSWSSVLRRIAGHHAFSN